MIGTTEIELPGGVRLHCRVAGPLDAPRLVFLHGFPEAAFAWDPVLERLADGFRCIAPNLRGYAPSSAPSEVDAYRARHLIGDIAALIAHLGGDAIVVAHDWGGALAWALAAQRPDGVRRLVIVNAPHPALFLRELKRNPQQQAASAYIHFLIRPDAERLLSENDFARMWRFLGTLDSTGEAAWLDEPMRERYRELWRAGLTGPLNYYRASLLRPPTETDRSIDGVVIADEAATVRLPTLVIWGEADRALPPSLLDGLDRYVPQLRIERVPGASHWIIHELPDLVARLIGEFTAEGG